MPLACCHYDNALVVLGGVESTVGKARLNEVKEGLSRTLSCGLLAPVRFTGTWSTVDDDVGRLSQCLLVRLTVAHALSLDAVHQTVARGAERYHVPEEDFSAEVVVPAVVQVVSSAPRGSAAEASFGET
jgi:hypothetical protein